MRRSLLDDNLNICGADERNSDWVAQKHKTISPTAAIVRGTP
jgi:hypothetical protein